MLSVTATPTAADQLLFLARVQRLLDSGRFTATYKFALLLALAELAVELGDDSGSALRLPLDSIAERFIALYWRQATPYVGNGQAAVLRQNTGRQAAIITRIAQAHRSLDLSLGVIKGHREWPTVIQDAKRIIVTMPLLRLQTIGNDDTVSSGECFLYENIVPESELVLFPGVAFCLRRFFSLLQGLVRAKWLGWVQAQNSDVLGTVQDLESFMFGSDRSNVRKLTQALLDLQNGMCFYQPRVALDKSSAQVDHFIPWAKYPCDVMANFVLASPSANAKKKDHLPAVEHLDRWCERNRRYRDQLMTTAQVAGVECGENAIRRVAVWAYGSHEAINGLVWHATRGLIPLDPKWQQLLRL